MSFLKGDGGNASPVGTIDQIVSGDGSIIINNPTGPIVGLEAAAVSGFDPWASKLASSTSIGATTVSLQDALPAMLVTSGILNIYVIIDAWSLNAELANASVDATGKVLTLGRSGQALQHAHASGAPVILLQNGNLNIFTDWFGVVPNNTGKAANNITAINNCLTQLQYLGGVGASVYGGQGVTYINAQIGTGGTYVGLNAFNNCYLVCTADFGSGKYCLDLGDNSAEMTGVACISAVPGMTMAQYLAGGRNPPVAMDGIHLHQKQVVFNLTVKGFRHNFTLDFDHGTAYNCNSLNGETSYYWPGGEDAGDQRFYQCDSNNAFRSHNGYGEGANAPQGSRFIGYSWFGSPWDHYFEGGGSGASIQTGILFQGNVEFSGNGTIFIAAGAGQVNISGWTGLELHPGNSSGQWYDSTYSTDSAVVNASGTSVLFSSNQGDITAPYGFNCINSGSLIQLSGDNQLQLTSTVVGLVKLGFDPSGTVTATPSSQVISKSGLANGIIIIQTAANNADDLMETVIVSGYSSVQPYQTSGKPPVGVNPLALTGTTGGAVTLLNAGVVAVNVHTGNSVAAASYVKPDLTNPGAVVQASSFSDGPIVGYSMFASTGGKVTIKLMV